MTCIIGLKTDTGTVILGADKRTSLGEDQYVDGGAPKLKQIKPWLTIGTAGNGRPSQIILDQLKPPKPAKRNPKEYLSLQLIPAMRKCLVAHGIDANDLLQCSEWLIAIGLKLFYLGEDWHYYEIEKFDCIGSGGDIAWGALGIRDYEDKAIGGVDIEYAIFLASRRKPSVSTTCDLIYQKILYRTEQGKKK